MLRHFGGQLKGLFWDKSWQSNRDHLERTKLCLWPGLVLQVVTWHWLDMLTAFPHKLKIKVSRLWDALHLGKIWSKTSSAAGFANVGQDCLNSSSCTGGPLLAGEGPRQRAMEISTLESGQQDLNTFQSSPSILVAFFGWRKKALFEKKKKTFFFPLKWRNRFLFLEWIIAFPNTSVFWSWSNFDV